MESLERANSRIANRLDKSILEPTIVKSMNDIKRVLAEFDPAMNREAPVVSVSAVLSTVEQGKVKEYAVSAPTKSKSKRDQLIEGMEMIRNRAEIDKTAKAATQSIMVNGREVKPPSLGDSVNGHTWVDPLIKHWMGAQREGETIYWNLDDGYKYKYDIFNHKLTRVKNE